MGVTKLAFKHPVAVVMTVLAIIVLGLLGFTKLPVELNPPVNFPTVTIRTSYAGTNPQEMETLITKPIEDSIAGVSGIKQITSTSQQGVSSITCQFYLGTAVVVVACVVFVCVAAVRKALPAAAAPSVRKLDTSQQSVIRLVMEAQNESPRDLRDLADNVVTQRLEQAPDVASGNVTGGEQREIQVNIDRDRLNAYGITIGQVASAIEAANSNVSVGYIQTGPQYADIRFLGEFATVDELKNLSLSFPATGSTAVSTSTATTTPVASTGGNQIVISLGVFVFF